MESVDLGGVEDDFTVHLMHFKQALGIAKDTLLKLLKRHKEWTLIDAARGTFSFNEFQICRRVVPGRPERYVHVIKDHEQVTRATWDRDIFRETQEHETYKEPEGDITVVRNVCGEHTVLGVYNRTYNRSTQTHMIVFRSIAEHPHILDAKTTLSKPVTACCVVRALENDTSEVILICDIVDAKILAARLDRYAHVVGKWKEFYPPSTNSKVVENRK